MENQVSHGFSRLASGKLCKLCKMEVAPDSRRSRYCSIECADKAKLTQDRVRKKRRAEMKASMDTFVEEDRSGKFRTAPAWPHRFDENMICRECGLTWTQNQVPNPCADSGLHPCTPEGTAIAIAIRRVKEEKRRIRAEKRRQKKLQEAKQ